VVGAIEDVGEDGGERRGGPVGLAAPLVDCSADVLDSDAYLARDGVADGADVGHDEFPQVAARAMLPSDGPALVVRQPRSGKEGATADLTFGVQEVAHVQLVGVRVVKVGVSRRGARRREGLREEAGEELVRVDGKELGLIVGEEGDEVEGSIR